MEFKFGSWNLNNRRPTRAHINFLGDQNLNLLAAQEVSEEFHAELSKSKLFDWSVSSQFLRPPRLRDSKTWRRDNSIFGCAPFSLQSSNLITQLPFPETALVSETMSNCARHLTVCSFHIPPGASWEKIKTKTGDAIAEWLAAQQGSLIFGIDANGPRIDHPIPEPSHLYQSS